jgi:peptide/nickel transport system substrate-binding protein
MGWTTGSPARTRPRTLSWAVLVAVVALVAAGCAGQTTTPTTGAPVEGGVATFAEPANTTPNYIFPFMGPEYFSVITISDFQYLMYRPLYWFGDKDKPVLNDRLSLANQPTYADNNRT